MRHNVQPLSIDQVVARKEQAEIEIRIRAQRKLGLSRDQAYALFAAHWPVIWLEGKSDPLPLIDHITFSNKFRPNPKQAVKVLRRLLNYGFSHLTFTDYKREGVYV